MTLISEIKKEISWDEIKAAVELGTADEIIKSGDLIQFNLKTGEEVAVRVTRDRKGQLFFVLEDCLEDEHAMNETWTNKGGWAECEMRKFLNTTVFALLPDELQAAIKPTKIVQVLEGKRIECQDNLFLLSRTQVFGGNRYLEQEPEDSQLDVFMCEKSRVKQCGDRGTWFWWLRSPNTSHTNAFWNVYTGGSESGSGAGYACGVAFGFCI